MENIIIYKKLIFIGGFKINKNGKWINLLYFFPILIAIISVLNKYPRLYGTDSFDIIWMAKAIRNGALFSENTWLIHPTSYFGFYPFSHRAIGIPLVIAFLYNILEFVSNGFFGISEIVLIFDIVIIIIIALCSRALGKTLYDEEWVIFIFTSAVLFSPNIINDFIMTVSTRIIITIVMLVLLNLSLKIFKNSSLIRKNIPLMALTIGLSSLAHRLWLGTLILIFLMIFFHYLKKYDKMRKYIVISILPICIIAFFIGLELFTIDPRKILSPFFDNSTIIGIFVNLTIHYFLDIGIILIFLPISIGCRIYQDLQLFFDLKNEYKSKNNTDQLKDWSNLYLLLFIIPYSFLAPSFYATTIFLPLLVIYSIDGLIFFKNYMQKNFPKLINKLFPFLLILLAISYSFLYNLLIYEINLTIFILITSILLPSYIVFVILKEFLLKKSKFYKIINRNQFQKSIEVFVIFSAILIFSYTSVIGRLNTIDHNQYPWENSYLTEEEQKIIKYLENSEIKGMIFTNLPVIASRISAVGFLPAFHDTNYIGTALYYNLINATEVLENTGFSISAISDLNFFGYNGIDPLRDLRNRIIILNVSVEGNLTELQNEYKIQYIITTKSTISSPNDNWILIQSLYNSFHPIFSTEHLSLYNI